MSKGTPAANGSPRQYFPREGDVALARSGSGKLFRFLGKHLVNDLIHLHVKIHAEREI